MADIPRVLPSNPDRRPMRDEHARQVVTLAIAHHIADILEEEEIDDEGNLRPPPRSQEMGRRVLEGVTEILFTMTLRNGYFRFPNGYGSFKVQRLRRNHPVKRLPTGTIVPMPPSRVKLRYEEGAAIRDVLGAPKKTNFVRRSPRQTKLTRRARTLVAGA